MSNTFTNKGTTEAVGADGVKTHFSLDSFKRVQERMVATNDSAWQNRYNRYSLLNKTKDYSLKEIEKIINSGSAEEQQQLSRNYFYKDGFYKQILIHYATLLKYAGVLIPNPAPNKSLSDKSIQKRYYNALNFVDKMSLQNMLTNCSLKALIDGAYYGALVAVNKSQFVLLDLPSGYCQTRFKDFLGNDIVEFNVTYFTTISDEKIREEALSLYPKVISSHYRRWLKKKVLDPWVIVPAEIGICFPFFNSRPLFLNVIPATIQYDEAVDTERERDLEEIRKIIVQKIPHLTDGGLLFEPEEMVEIHQGTVGMMRQNKNVSVLTTYADVDAIVSKTAADTASNTLEKMVQNIYAQAGVSGELFATTGSSSLETSIKYDTALMMSLANKYSLFITNTLDKLFGNSSVSFKYTILPITWHNESDYISDTFKLAQSGYSFILPALALGLSQRDIVSIKDLENDVLKLGEKFIPLSSAYTQSAEGKEEITEGTTEVGGAPKKDTKDKTETTIKKEESIEKQGGSN